VFVSSLFSVVSGDVFGVETTALSESDTDLESFESLLKIWLVSSSKAWFTANKLYKSLIYNIIKM